MRRGVLGITGLGLITTLSLTACGSQPSDPPGGSATAAGTATAASGTATAGAAAETSNNSPGGDYFTYTNERFRFSVTLPPSFAPLGDEPTNGDGRRFSPDGGRVVVTVYGGNNALDETAAGAAAAFVAQKNAENARITLNNVSGNTYTVSGYDQSGDNIWYEHKIVQSQVEFGIDWTYPASLKAKVDPEVTVSVQSFEPGPNKPA
ncbi:hypothetical protein [Amycolatopsis taiwanensis]|uniref:hypothetical protein n=1 Tax=Amycolatopsis taiwanensis TaxID=342230 RepID=UPI000483EF69|nr:hypothetical protein [Amycolatopsis taiwanensis]